MQSHVWYACYGSNLSLDRFRCYLEGGAASGAGRAQPGCRDATAPTGDRSTTIGGQLRFARHSPSWGGGVAFLDTEAPGAAEGRAYRLSVGQLGDVVAQENARPPGSVALDPSGVVAAGRSTLCRGWYGSLVHVGALDGEPMFTITSVTTADEEPSTPPSAAYVRTIAIGLAETRGWSAHKSAAYLLGCPGVAPAWDLGELGRACSP